MEIERKFTVRRLPENLEQYPCRIIEQAYLNTDPVVRVRRQDDDYYMTYKGKGLLAREEYNLPLNETAYYHLREKADGNVISKKRYVIPIAEPAFTDGVSLPASAAESSAAAVPSAGESVDPVSLCVELDIFEPPFAPLVIAEVEFPSEELANAFVPLDWFDRDVTHDPAYHNSNMSRRVF